MSHYHWGQCQTHASHVVPPMGPIVLVMTEKADLSAKPGNAIVNE